MHGMADTSMEVFRKHLNPIFIESGTTLGAGVTKALDAGFPEVYSIELSPQYYLKCLGKFQFDPRVHLYLGNSAEVLKKILPSIDQRATFWLDGHFCGGDSAIGATHTPILDELKAIASHHIKTHTIMIDDVRLFGKPEFDFIEIDEVIELLLRINPEYHISFEDGYIANDVLVAEIP